MAFIKVQIIIIAGGGELFSGAFLRTQTDIRGGAAWMSHGTAEEREKTELSAGTVMDALKGRLNVRKSSMGCNYCTCIIFCV